MVNHFMWRDSETNIDLLHFDYLVQTVESIAKDSSLTPSTIGIYGDWGSGKSSLMKMVQEDLSKEDGVLCIKINGWLFEGYDDARTSLCGTILDEINHEERYREKIKDKLSKLIKQVDYKKILAKGAKFGLDLFLTGGISTMSEFALEGIISHLKSHAGDLKEEDIKKVIDAVTQRESKRHEIKEFSNEFSEMLKKSDIKHLIVFIDELDRCQPNTILEIFEAIRLFLYVEGITFIIGADERLVQYAIKTKYKEIPGSDLDIGKEYLEKLIQYPITIPQLTEYGVSHYITCLLVDNSLDEKEYKRFLNIVRPISEDTPIDYELINKADKTLANSCRDAIALSDQISFVLAQILKGNPRQCKRFLNTLFMRLNMAKIRKAELNKNLLAKLMLVEYFKPMFFKEFFNPERFEDLKELEKGEGLSGSNKLESWSKDKDTWVGKWLKSSPSLPNTFDELYQYLFYSRDKFRYGRSIVNALGERASKCFDLIMSKSPTHVGKAIAFAKDLSPAETSGLVSALFTEMRKEEKLDKVILKTALTLNSNNGLRDESVKILLSIPLDKMAPAIIPFVITETEGCEHQKDLLEYLKGDKHLKSAIDGFEKMK